MRTLSVTEMNRNPSEPLRQVQAGQTVIITSHGKPVAKIIGISEDERQRTLKALALTPEPSPRSHFIIPPFLDKASRKPYQGEKMELPLHLNLSHKGLVFDMAKETTRARVYEIVLQEGSLEDLQEFVDFNDLVRLWSTLYLPSDLQTAWETMYPQLKRSSANA